MTDCRYKWKRGTALKPGDMVRIDQQNQDCLMVYKVVKGFAGEALILFKAGLAQMTDHQEAYEVRL